MNDDYPTTTEDQCGVFIAKNVLVFSYLFEKYGFFNDFYRLLKRKVNSVTIFIIFRFVVAKETYLRKTAKDWA